MEQTKTQLETDIDRAQDQQNMYELFFQLISLIINFIFSTIINRLSSELNRLVNELTLERDILLDFQDKLDAAEYVHFPNLLHHLLKFFRMIRTKAIIERARYNQQENVLNEKESALIEHKQSLTKLRRRQEDWKVTQMKRAHLSALEYDES
jgi:hypothetical protein